MTAIHRSSAVTSLVDAGCLPLDPTARLLESDEPSARLATLCDLLGSPVTGPDVIEARAAILADQAIRALISDLPTTGAPPETGDHTSPLFIPNRLGILADLGVRFGDNERLDALVRIVLAGADRHGRLALPPSMTSRPKPEQGAVTCDSNALVDAFVRLGLANDPAVAKAAQRLAGDSASSPEGRGWSCLPEKRPLVTFRAPKAHACPQVTLEGARALAHLPRETRPAWAPETARTLLAFWRARTEHRPYDFGHGYQFKTVKWPHFWYSALLVLDVTGRYPELWSGPHADPADRRAVAELASSLIAHNVGPDGMVTPLRTYRGFESLSLGRRDEPSAYASAVVITAVARFAAIAEDIARVDSTALPVSKPLSVRPVKARSQAVCPVPRRRAYETGRVLPRVLTRHHVGTPWEPASIESLVSDVVGLVATDPAGPYLSLAARLPAFDASSLDRALDDHRSLVRFRCMRGVLYTLRRDFVATAHAASHRQVVRYARDFATAHGVNAASYEALSQRVLEECAEAPMTTSELRERLRPDVDLAAVVTLMCAEAALLRCAPRDGRFGRATTFSPFEAALPDVTLGRMSEDDARAALLRAYVRGFGPVSERDAAWWTGMDLKRVRRAFDALEDELVDISLTGHEGTWLMHAADAEELERASLTGGPHVTLLPALDPLLTSYTDRSRFIDDAYRERVFDSSRNAAPVVLVDGRVVGVWDVTHGDEPSVVVHLFEGRRDDMHDALEHEAERVATLTTGSPAPVRLVPDMTPLSRRPVGAFRHPLR